MEKRKWIRIIAKIVLISFALGSAVLIYFIIGYLIYLLGIGILVLTLILIASLVHNHILREHCKNEEEREINGIKYVLCYTDVVNAWYNMKTKKIYISKAFAEHLTDDELKAVIYHEMGHARNKLINRIYTYAYIFWILSIAGMIIVVLVLPSSSLSIIDVVIGVGILYILGGIITTSAMIISWIAEHESDKIALKNAGLEPTIRMLVKVHIYGALSDVRVLGIVSNCRIKNIEEWLNKIIKENKSYFKTILFHGLKFPREILDFLLNPIYYTHPPIQFRINFLAHQYSEKNA